jgi:hypothetical protein
LSLLAPKLFAVKSSVIERRSRVPVAVPVIPPELMSVPAATVPLKAGLENSTSWPPRQPRVVCSA